MMKLHRRRDVAPLSTELRRAKCVVSRSDDEILESPSEKVSSLPPSRTASGESSRCDRSQRRARRSPCAATADDVVWGTLLRSGKKIIGEIGRGTKNEMRDERR